MADTTSSRWRRVQWIPQAAMYLGGFLLLRWATRFLYPNGEKPLAGAVLYAAWGIAMVGIAVFVVGGLSVVLSAKKSVESMEIRAGASDGWPPASFAMHDRFSKLGFEQFGSLEVTFPDHTATFAGMLSPDGTTMGIVTPMHLVMMSDFDGKLLTTTNRPAGAAVRYELRQYHRAGSPEDLWDMHKTGIAATAEAGLSATVYNAASAMAAFLAIEQHATTQFALGDQMKGIATVLPIGRRIQALAGTRGAATRIAAWRESPYRWTPQVS